MPISATIGLHFLGKSKDPDRKEFKTHKNYDNENDERFCIAAALEAADESGAGRRLSLCVRQEYRIVCF